MNETNEQYAFHPRKDPQYDAPLSPQAIEDAFSDCVDFIKRGIQIGEHRGHMYYVLGMARNERVSDYLLKPIAQTDKLKGLGQMEALEMLHREVLYDVSHFWQDKLEDVLIDMTKGNVIFAFDGIPVMLSCIVPTEEKRSISPPENEPAIRGGKDSFVESIRTNTSLVRRRLRLPSLKIQEQVVGRQSRTYVDVVYIEGLTNPSFVEETKRRLESIDIDALIEAGQLEEYMNDDATKTAFPLMAYTERPDRFCANVIDGRVGIIVDGLPLGFMLPTDIGLFFKATEDKSKNWIEASFLRLLRYSCMFVALFLPALYVAAVNFHHEMLPASLAWSIMQAKIDVPFSTLFELIMLLLAFEIVQEAGLRLPPAIGTTVSILGGLVVGTAAVQASLISPAVLIVVAAAGIAGFTMPSQGFAGALRLWRLVFVIVGGVAGMFGVISASVVLVYHLASLESYGVPYLVPFASAGGEQLKNVLRLPLPFTKFRERALKTKNRRMQR